VKTIYVKISFRRRPQPHIIVDTFRYRLVRLLRRTDPIIEIAPDINFPEFTLSPGATRLYACIGFSKLIPAAGKSTNNLIEDPLLPRYTLVFDREAYSPYFSVSYGIPGKSHCTCSPDGHRKIFSGI
jgi:hypothetical protein